jgi:putative proteasome-type protease
VAKKISIHQYEQHSLFILTSGLRSIRDKAVTYFEERLQRGGAPLSRMYEAANALAEEIRRVRTEDKPWLVDGGLAFDLHCLFGGQLSGDDEAHLYLIYPEGNWVEVRAATPYAIIGESRYGKPILDRVWRHSGTLAGALQVGLLAFDATRTSASDVDTPVDVVLYRSGTFALQEQRYERDDLDPLRRTWQQAIEAGVVTTRPVADALFVPLNEAPAARTHYEDASGGA